MSLAKSLFLGVIVCLALPLMAVAQSTDLTTAGATPLCANFDVWPNFLPDSGFGGLDVGAIGVDTQSGHEEFVFGGMANDNQCGSKVAVVSQAGIQIAERDALVDDNGTAFLGAAAIAHYGEIGGFGWNFAIDGDPTTGNFMTSEIFFNNDIDVVFPNPVQFFTYAQSDLGASHINDHYVSQRFTRDAAKVSNMTAGRNVPSAASHTQTPWFTADGHGSRIGGCAILSNGNSLHYISDRSRSGSTDVDKGVVEYFADNNIVPGLNNGTSHRCNVHTVTSPDANTFVVSTTPTFVNRSTMGTFDNGTTQQVATGSGWFAMRADSNSGTLAFFKNNGARITQIYGYKTLYEETDGLLPNADDVVTINGGNAVSASNDTLFVACRYQPHTDGIDHPAVLRFELDSTLSTVTLLPIIIADSDYAAPALASVSENTIDIHANAAGAFVIGWRKDVNEETGAGAPVVRVYDADGTPVTSSFYPSSLADPKTDTAAVLGGMGNQQVKVAMNNNVVCVGWYTENGVTTVDAPDCSGVPKSAGAGAAAISTAARIFQVNLASSAVGNWDLY